MRVKIRKLFVSWRSFGGVTKKMREKSNQAKHSIQWGRNGWMPRRKGNWKTCCKFMVLCLIGKNMARQWQTLNYNFYGHHAALKMDDMMSDMQLILSFLPSLAFTRRFLYSLTQCKLIMSFNFVLLCQLDDKNLEIKGNGGRKLIFFL